MAQMPLIPQHKQPVYGGRLPNSDFESVLEELNDLGRTVERYKRQQQQQQLQKKQQQNSYQPQPPPPPAHHDSLSRASGKQPSINLYPSLHRTSSLNRRHHPTQQQQRSTEFHHQQVRRFASYGHIPVKTSEHVVNGGSMFALGAAVPVMTPRQRSPTPSPPPQPPIPPVQIPTPEMPRPPTPPMMTPKPRIGPVHWCRGERGGCAGVESCKLRHHNAAEDMENAAYVPLPTPEEQLYHQQYWKTPQGPTTIDPTLPTSAWQPEDEESRRKLQQIMRQREDYAYRVQVYQARMDDYQRKLGQRQMHMQDYREAETRYQRELEAYHRRVAQHQSRMQHRRSQSAPRQHIANKGVWLVARNQTVAGYPRTSRSTERQNCNNNNNNFISSSSRNDTLESRRNYVSTFTTQTGGMMDYSQNGFHQPSRQFARLPGPAVATSDQLDTECVGLEPIGPGVLTLSGHNPECTTANHNHNLHNQNGTSFSADSAEQFQSVIASPYNLSYLNASPKPVNGMQQQQQYRLDTSPASREITVKTVGAALNSGLLPTPVSGTALAHAVRKTSPQWYKPQMTREQAVDRIANLPLGSFFIRESTTYPNSFGLALKTDRIPQHALQQQLRPNESPRSQYCRHFLIERSSNGFQIRGYDFEPVFGSLADLVAYHCRNPTALPCALRLPGYAPVPSMVENVAASTGGPFSMTDSSVQPPILGGTMSRASSRTRSKNRSRSRTPNKASETGEIYKSQTQLAPINCTVLEPIMKSSMSHSANSLRQVLPRGAACLLYYLGCVEVEQLSGPMALQLAIDRVFNTSLELIRPIEVTFHVNADGITMTDVQRRSFFRRYFPVAALFYMGVDPGKRRWAISVDGTVHELKILGFVARLSDYANVNRCHIVTECERGESAEIVANFVNTYLLVR